MGDSRSTTPVLSKGSFSKLHSLMNSIGNESDETQNLNSSPTTVQSYTSGSSLTGGERWSRFQFSALETSLGRLQRDQRISGFLLKLGTTATTASTASSSNSTNNDAENKLSWLQRFLVLTPFAELFLFRTNTLSSSNAPVTYLCVDACRGSHSDAHDAWILEVSGDGVGSASGRIEKVAWIIKCPNEAVLNMWLRELSDVIRTVEEKFPQYAAAARKTDRVVDLVVEYDRPPTQQKKGAAAATAAASAVAAVAAVAAAKGANDAGDVQRRGDSLDFDGTRKSVRIGKWRDKNVAEENDQNEFLSEVTGGKEVKRSFTAPVALKGSLKKATISPDDARGEGTKKDDKAKTDAGGQPLRRSASHTPSTVYVPNPVQMISIRKSFGRLKDAKGGWFTWLSKK
ncbi:hypothetical protein HK100_003904 [Physocladia obscura]|uniref:PH domain-containing protein n=1 Tax=Physocladia obscura TaxID=109957 RepID=A0AAD5SZE2_9FUNG|nr:hypothetical protein HK100_003904 [Physocladia obscura]